MRRSVLDYFYILPFVANGPTTKSERRELLSQRNKHILDLKNEYIEVDTDSFPNEIPRYGTTIHVYRIDLKNQRRSPALDLKWRNGKFIRSPRS